ncbi:RNA polymerase-ADP-ribosyltransferase [Escherichia phage MLP2]|uniref:NAD(+)--arginine ADP-ribosyltransferase n=1 Tax=Escherichia phage vB_EcoM_JB75 TaxID=2234085 RepID=A0A2Z5H2K9_9CAUD|nr:RNA polymerase-ADP-ribosyltransferase [Escherichia phage vB_EcoM_JB75]EJV2547985.1 ADP-ribosyltransferase [Shigella flexneri]QNJ50813.1 RNA polymerase-ADP-ribosyltransferase [Yersinia phage PYps55T]QZI80394.1 putative RNA polymerase-ADP-ribosyltransferase [Escherichia phage vB_EcoM-CHD2BS1]QZI80837.1 putative RNA polymerase-ADP-ribosyltransferase [Escherichia phage vB_EcoM-CHD16UKE1]QZI81576.1 putative RNA polymerase-ADP-ribosyltransferase [Escherichia phage vB_EcoM-G3F6]QZI82156.1 putativ
MELITELFDEDTTLPITNLNPKKKIPQIFSVHVDDAIEQPGFRLCTYTSGGDTNRDLKMGDKMMHIVPFTLTAKGSIAKLKGLGPSPINYINSVFTVAMQTMRQYKIDACMLRILKSKTAGQARQIQVIADRLIRSRSGGRYVLLKELWDYDKKYAYILIHRKNVSLEDIPGVPEISTELFTKVESKVGDVYINKDTGAQVTKNEAIAASIAQENDKRSDQAVIVKVKISRRAIAQSQSLESSRFETPMFQKFEASAAELNKPADAPLISDANELTVISTSGFALENALSSVTAGMAFREASIIPEDKESDVNAEIKNKALERLRKESITSIKTLETIASIVDDTLEKYKGAWLERNINKHSHLNQDAANELVQNSWNAIKTKIIRRELRGYALTAGWSLHPIVENKDSSKYTPAQKRGIREYVSSGYVDINNALLGLYNPDERTSILTASDIEKAIDNLDSAFKNGERLPKGITLYRSQRMLPSIYEALVKNRVFYFRNFVSTSLYPNIFGTWMTDSSVGVLPDEKRLSVSIDKTDEGLVNSSDNLVGIGWVITGADKVNVVLPGGSLAPSNEMEVILPRGLMVKVNKITDASYNDGTVKTNNKLIQAEVMTTEELTESVIYDGDRLMETGEVVTMTGDIEIEDRVDFASFVSSNVKQKVESSLGIIASCIDIANMPYKFVQG